MNFLRKLDWGRALFIALFTVGISTPLMNQPIGTTQIYTFLTAFLIGLGVTPLKKARWGQVIWHGAFALLLTGLLGGELLGYWDPPLIKTLNGWAVAGFAVLGIYAWSEFVSELRKVLKKGDSK